nr:DNA polymerase I [Desulfobulbaceae bacterium]
MTSNSPIYIIDGNAYIYRAFHAIAPLSNKEGLPTNAIYGFINILLRVIREKEPQYIAIAFDAKGPNFRHQQYPEYKANRPPMPEDLVVQLPYIRDLVKAHNILTLEKPGVEADDTLASVATTFANQGHQVIIVSGDKDLLQLVSKQITVWEPMLDRVMDPAAVEKKYTVAPDKLLDLFALMGDKSDNIPGVPGIGPKTAGQLIEQFGTIENLYDNLNSVKRLKLLENLQNNRENAFISKALIELKTDVDVPQQLADYKVQIPDNAKLTELYTYLDFSRLLKETKQCQSLDTAAFHLITSAEDLEKLAERLKGIPYLTIDTETTSLDTLTAELVGISIAGPEDDFYYIPLSHQDLEGNQCSGQFSLEVINKLFSKFFTNPRLPKLGHNIKYDYAVLKQNGVTMQGPLWDTMLAAYLIDPSRTSYKLDDLSAELLDVKLTSFAEVTKANKNADAFRFVSLEDGANYSCEDVYATKHLWEQFEPELDALGLWPVFSQVETPLIPVLANMELHGVCLNCDLLNTLSDKFHELIEVLNKKIFSLAGMEFNISSPKQLAEILFEKLKLPHGRKTKTGYSTDMNVLEKLSSMHELPRLLIEHRTLTKLKTTYVDKLPALVHPKTGRLHTSFNQAVTATGRLSSSNPNLQNIPIRSNEGQQIRAAFIPAAGFKFIAADYSQIDLRVLAHYSQDPALIKAFCTGEDIHQQTASEIFQIMPQFVTNQMRRVAKSINFGIVYGMSAFGLSAQLNISRKDAKTFIDRYFDHYRGVKNFMSSIVEQAKETGYVTTLLGRRRNLPDINSPNKTRREFAERTALNSPIQGTAADIIKLASINVDQQLKQHNLQANVLLQIHDELVLEVPDNELEKTATLIKNVMESVLDLSVPLLVNVSVGENLAKS